MAKTGPKPDFDVKEAFDYKDGKLFWRHSKRGGRKVGGEVGYQGKKYKFVKIGERYYLVHRLIYFFHTGEWPELVDHIDCDKSNNRIENLRAANKSVNALNVKDLRSSNKSGFNGVYWSKRSNKWAAQCVVNGKTCYIGVFEDLIDAAKSVKDYLSTKETK